MQTLDKRQKKVNKTEFYSVDQMEHLINSIKKVKNLSDEEISEATKSAKGYIAQVRSRAKKEPSGGVSPKFMHKLKSLLANLLQNAKVARIADEDVHDIKTSLGTIIAKQEDLLDQQLYTRAELRGVARYLVFQDSKDDMKAMEGLLEIYRKLVGGALKQDG